VRFCAREGKAGFAARCSIYRAAPLQPAALKNLFIGIHARRHTRARRCSSERRLGSDLLKSTAVGRRARCSRCE